MIASKIIEARKTAGLKQDELAKMVGVSVTSANLWENGKQIPKLESLIAIAKITKRPLVWFFSSDSEALNTEEIFILKVFRNLNKNGKNHMLEFVENLQEIAKYKKCNSRAVVNS